VNWNVDYSTRVTVSNYVVPTTEDEISFFLKYNKGYMTHHTLKLQ
jgi:hypothetical protein